MDVKKFLSEFYKGTKKQTLGTVIYFMKKYRLKHLLYGAK